MKFLANKKEGTPVIETDYAARKNLTVSIDTALANELLLYIRRTRPIEITRKDHAVERVNQGNPSPQMIDHMARRYGAECVVFLAESVALLTGPLMLECEFARLAIKQAKESAASDPLATLSQSDSEDDECETITQKRPTSAPARSTGSTAANSTAIYTSTRRIPKAYRWEVCDVEQVKQKMASTHSDRQPDRTQLMARLASRTVRELPRVTTSMIAKVSALAQDYPNFEQVVKYVCRRLTMCRLLNQPVHIPPLLLSGPPGVGKTQFLKTLASVLSGEFSFVNMGETTAGFVLTGQSRGWAEGATGLVARSIIDAEDGKVAVIMLDEMDKTHGHSQFPADRCLLGLLEQHTASHFRDESLDLDFDTRPVCWFLTCNEVRAVRPEILSRVHHLEILIPSKDQMPRVIRSIDSAIRQKAPKMSKLFEPLDQAVAEELSALPPRIAARVLEEAYGRTAETCNSKNQKLKVSPAMVLQVQAELTPTSTPKNTLGFLH